jgi:hypothetical protein
MGMSALKSHERGKRYIERSVSVFSNQQILAFGLPPAVSNVITSASATTTALTTGSMTESVLVPPASVSAATSSASTSTMKHRDKSDEAVIALTSVCAAAGKNSKGLPSFMVKDTVTRAEIIWAVNGVMSHASLRDSAGASELFHVMFPDSEIASHFKMQKDKSAYVVTYGLGPFFRISCQILSANTDSSAFH